MRPRGRAEPEAVAIAGAGSASAGRPRANVAAITLFLASPLAKYLTSSSFNVDGGSIRSIV